MKFHLILVVLLGVTLPILACADKISVKPIRNDIDLDEEEEEGEWDFEKEVFGPQMERFEGLNILDENLNIVLTDPSERVLRALAEPMEGKNALTLEKVKAIYRERMEKEQREGKKQAAYTKEDFEEMLAKEQKVAEKEAAAEDTVMQRVLNLLW